MKFNRAAAVGDYGFINTVIQPIVSSSEGVFAFGLLGCYIGWKLFSHFNDSLRSVVVRHDCFQRVLHHTLEKRLSRLKDWNDLYTHMYEAERKISRGD